MEKEQDPQLFTLGNVKYMLHFANDSFPGGEETHFKKDELGIYPQSSLLRHLVL